MTDTKTVFNWVDWERRLGYVGAVHEAFGLGGASNEEVLERLMPPMPRLVAIQLEITSWCNLACQQCGRTLGLKSGNWKNAHMPLDRYRAIVEKVPSAAGIFLQGVGEPSLHPDFVEMIDIAFRAGKFNGIHFNTNGLTHNDAYWAELGRYPNLKVALSVDSLDPDIAELCRSGTRVNLLWDRLQLFHRTFSGFNVALVASRLNLDDIERTLEQIATLGNVRVQVTRMGSDDDSVVLQPEHEHWLAEGLNAMRDRFPGLGLYFNPNAGVNGNEKRCVAPFLRPFILVDGALTPCCSAPDAKHYGYANIVEARDWNELRSDPRVIDWVTSFVHEDPPVCRGCPMNPNKSALVKPRQTR